MGNFIEKVEKQGESKKYIEIEVKINDAFADMDETKKSSALSTTEYYPNTVVIEVLKFINKTTYRLKLGKDGGIGY